MNALIVEDSRALSQLLADGLKGRGHEARQSFHLQDALRALDEQWPDAVILDAMFPTEFGAADFNAPEVLNVIDARQDEPRPLVVLISGDERTAGKFATIRDWWFTGRVAGVLSKNEGGGWEFFKEIVLQYLDLYQVQQPESEDAADQEGWRWLERNKIISTDKSMCRLASAILRCIALTDNDHPVLIVGPNGTGKTLVARAIWNEMQRKRGAGNLPFIQLHCGDIQLTTLRSELFGHVRGSFTDARETVDGLMKTAGEGVLFLDDIQFLPKEARATLLSPIQERTFRQVGGKPEIEFRARLVSSTNIDLEKLQEEGGLPEEFYHRISGTVLFVPPLSQRLGDIAAIAQDFAAKGPAPKRLRADAIRALQAYAWPGNVRQLAKVIRSIQINHPAETVTLQSLRALGLDYLGKPIEWLTGRAAPVDWDSLLGRFGWQGGWAKLGQEHEELMVGWLRNSLPNGAQIDALVACLQNRKAPKAFYYYKALLYSVLRGGEISHQPFQETLGLGWDFTNRVLCYLAGEKLSGADGFALRFLLRKNVRGKYVYCLT